MRELDRELDSDEVEKKLRAIGGKLTECKK